VKRASVRDRLGRPVTGIVMAVGLGITLVACGGNGTALAKQACVHVDRSLTLLAAATRQTDAAAAAQLEEQAYVQLRQALPIAAQAAYRDGQWQSLMTTVSESNRVPETTLVPALRAQCGQADSATFGQSPPSTSIPPPAPFASSPSSP
jgi:hypothetical protein